MRLTVAAIVLAVTAAPALASQDAPSPPQDASKPVLTAEEGRQLYELGVKTGLAQASVQAMQQQLKPILEKLAPMPTPKQ